jgi:hypothetical protein
MITTILVITAIAVDIAFNDSIFTMRVLSVLANIINQIFLNI